MDSNSGSTHSYHGFKRVDSVSPGMLYNYQNVHTPKAGNTVPLCSKHTSHAQYQVNPAMAMHHELIGIACEVASTGTIIGAKQENVVPQLEFQSTSICPKNFIVFDQSDYRILVMFHPVLAQNEPILGFCNVHTYDNHDYDNHDGSKEKPFKGSAKDIKSSYKEDTRGTERSFKEDTRDIDALLSSDEGEEDDDISTDRSPWERQSNNSVEGLCMATSKDTSKAEELEFYERNPETVFADSQCTDQMMRKMMEALRKIIPGSEEMDPTDILDGALRYIELLKMEVKQLGLA